MAHFPPTGIGEDSSKFSHELIDNTISSETDGDYKYTRPRSGRAPKNQISTGFTDISDLDNARIMEFARTVGKFAIFEYNRPDTNELLKVRFTSLPKSAYAGAGGNHRYNVTDITMEEV